jgi:hypothetical protein
MRKIKDAQDSEQKASGAMTMRVGSAKAGANNKLMSAEQIQLLRAQIQKACQSANPLGKVIGIIMPPFAALCRVCGLLSAFVACCSLCRLHK